jgi:putative transposase
MKHKKSLPQRRSIRLKQYNYTQPGFYFITICCHKGECRFGRIKDGKMVLNEFGIIASTAWYGLPDRFHNFQSKIFQLMPNHMHAILALTEPVLNSNVPQSSVSEIIGAYKSIVSNKCMEVYQQNGKKMGRFWQKNYFEHVIRSEEGYRNIANYIATNPLNWDGDDIAMDLELFRRIESSGIRLTTKTP